MKLKKGVKFGPPVNRDVEAKDVKYAFERAATKNVPNQYTTYFNFIEGFPKKPGAIQDIPGIVVDNPNQITFKLTQAQGPGFAAFLIMPVTTPIPKEYAEKFDKESPSTYNENVVSPARTWSPTTRRASSPATRPASRSSSSVTRTGTRTWTSVRRTSTRSR